MSFARNLFTVSGLTLLSRVAGFVRDSLTALFLGTGIYADAFFVAQRLPNLFRSLFAEGAFSAAFVPLYSKKAHAEGQEKAQIFSGEALALLLSALAPFCVLVIVCMPWVIQLIAPGFNDDPLKYDAAIHYSRITFPYLLLISITALQSGVLNAQNHFGPGAAAPIAFNLVLIAALFFAYCFNLPIGETQCWAITLSGIVQAIWLALSCRRAKISVPLMRPRLTPDAKKLLQRVGPGAVGAGATQINLLISTALASFLPTGAVSYLYYADRLNQLPLGIVGIAVATTLLPVLSRHDHEGDHQKIRHYINRSIEFCLALGLPAAIGLAVAAEPIIQTLFEHGAFTPAATRATSFALMGYALGIPAFLLVKIFASRFFARNNTKTPVRIALAAMAANVLLSVIFLSLSFGHVGIALSNSIATWLNAMLLFMQLKRGGEKLGDPKLNMRLPRILFSAAIMAASCWLAVFLTQPLFNPLNTHKLALEIIGLCVIISASACVYALMLQFTGGFKWGDVKSLLKKNKP